jgi:uncharacterized protein YecT (DUF1311 family)
LTFKIASLILAFTSLSGTTGVAEPPTTHQRAAIGRASEIVEVSAMDSSYKCGPRVDPDGRFICEDIVDSLGPLDATMAIAYQAALHHTKDRSHLIARQRAWLGSRTTICRPVVGSHVPIWRQHQIGVCLIGLYDVRTAELRAEAAPFDPFANLKVFRDGVVGKITDGTDVLELASSEGDLPLVNRLLGGGVKQDLGVALYGAAWRGSTPLVKRLLQAGADPNAAISGSSPLAVSLEMDNRLVADILWITAVLFSMCATNTPRYCSLRS